MLTAITAVENIVQGRTDKSNIWAVNTEMEYQESRVTERDDRSLNQVPEAAKAS